MGLGEHEASPLVYLPRCGDHIGVEVERLDGKEWLNASSAACLGSIADGLEATTLCFAHQPAQNVRGASSERRVLRLPLAVHHRSKTLSADTTSAIRGQSLQLALLACALWARQRQSQ